MFRGSAPKRSRAMSKASTRRRANFEHTACASGQGVDAADFGATSQVSSRLLLHELFASIREGIFFITPKGQILDANPALVRMLSYENKEGLGSCEFRDGDGRDDAWGGA
jgi:PAS domain-containing protein